MKTKKLTEKETEIMQMLWGRGALTVREMLDDYPEPKPHFNTVSTTVRILEQKGHVAHEENPGGGYRYYAVSQIDDFRQRTLAEVVRNYFNNSYRSAVSALVEEEKISVDDLRRLIEMIDNKSAENRSENHKTEES